MNLEPKPLHPGEEVMLTGDGWMRCPDKCFNPHYGLVVIEMDGTVTVLWEDGVERRHQRYDLLSLKEMEDIMSGKVRA